MAGIVRCDIRRQRRYGRRVCGALLPLILMVGTAGCSQQPDDKKLRALATSDAAKAGRAQAEQRIRSLVDRLSSVDGLDHVSTQLLDDCSRPATQALLGSSDPQHALVCDMNAVAYFGVRDIVAVLPRIRAAGVAKWGEQDANGDDVPYAGGSVRYALDYYRNHGRYPDGLPMPMPELESNGMRISWDVPSFNLVKELPPCPGPFLYSRCEVTPDAANPVQAARAEYGMVLTLEIDPRNGYFTVPSHG